MKCLLAVSAPIPGSPLLAGTFVGTVSRAIPHQRRKFRTSQIHGVLHSRSANHPVQAMSSPVPASPLLAGFLVGFITRTCTLQRGRIATSRRNEALQTRSFSVSVKAQSAISEIDFRVGLIVSADRHPDSDKLLVEQIDIGEEMPRQICSGISAYYAPDDLIGCRVVIVSNLKERKMAGTASHGMLLCATTGECENRQLVLVEAPPETPAGERVVVDVVGEDHGSAAPPNRVHKKKLFEKIASDLRTDGQGVVRYKSFAFATSVGPCTAIAIPDGVVS